MLTVAAAISRDFLPDSTCGEFATSSSLYGTTSAKLVNLINETKQSSSNLAGFNLCHRWYKLAWFNLRRILRKLVNSPNNFFRNAGFRKLRIRGLTCAKFGTSWPELYLNQIDDGLLKVQRRGEKIMVPLSRFLLFRGSIVWASLKAHGGFCF